MQERRRKRQRGVWVVWWAPVKGLFEVEADVALHELGVATASTDGVSCQLSYVRLDIHDSDGAAAVGQRLSQRSADACQNVGIYCYQNKNSFKD